MNKNLIKVTEFFKKINILSYVKSGPESNNQEKIIFSSSDFVVTLEK